MLKLATTQIPFEAAAPFLVRLKTAGWADPPDVTGALEGAFTVPREVVLDKLKSVIAGKARLMLAWFTYAQSFKGDAWRAIKEEFHDHAAEEQEGFTYYTKRAAALGGPVHMDPVEPPPPASDPQAIFNLLARAEQEMILMQRELRDLVGDQNPMKVGIEEHMAHDQHHLDEMWQMMPQGASPMLAPAAPAVGAPEEVPQEVDQAAEPPAADAPEAKEAAARFRFALGMLRKEASGVPAVGKSVLQDALSGAVPARGVMGRYRQLLTGSRIPVMQDAFESGRQRMLAEGAKLRSAGSTGDLFEGTLGQQRVLSRLGELSNLQRLHRSIGDERAKVMFTRGATAGVPLGAGLAVAGHRAKQKEASEKDDALRVTGRDRAVTNLAAEAHREAGRRGERAGSVLGGIGGAVGGAALGKHLKAPMNSGRTVGAALGYLAGRSAGKEVGTEVDIHRNKAKTAAVYGFDGMDHVPWVRRKESVATETRSKSTQAKTAGVADVAPAFGGLSAGYGMGANAAETTARAVAPRRHDEAAGSAARRLAMVAAPVAGVGAMVAAHKLKAVPRALSALERLSPAGMIAEPAVEQEIARLAVPAGAALGGSLLGGAAAGGAVGALKHKEASAFVRALQKLAFGDPQAQGGQPQPMASSAAPPEMAPAAVGFEQPAPEPQPEAAGLEQSPFEAMNYLNAEQAGRAAQEQNESAYYRQKFQEAMQQIEMLHGDATAAQASADQLQQQHSLVNQDISAATNEALEANVEATRQAQAAANLRIGLEKMRQQLMGIVSQDPELLAQTPSMEPAMDPTLGDSGMGDPTAEAGPAGEAPSPGQPPGSAPPGPGASGESGAEPQKASGTPGTVVNIGAQPTEKRAGLKEHLRAAAPWALGGAAVGGALGAIPQHRKAEELRGRVQSLSAARKPGDYQRAKELSKNYAALHDAERVNASPLKGALSGALLGGATMAGIGPEVMKHIKDIRTYAH